MKKSGFKEGEDWFEPNQSLIHTHTHTPFLHPGPSFVLFACLQPTNQKKTTIW